MNSKQEAGSSKQISKKTGLIFCLGFLFAIYCLLFTTNKVSAATIYLSPASASVGNGSTFTVSVRVNTQGVDVNTAEASINYSTDTLDLVSVKQGTTFYLPSPGSPGRGGGSAYFAGGIPNPGYNGNGGTLGTMTFRAKAEGLAQIVVTSGSVLLNDGNGTNAFSGSAGARITIGQPAAATPTAGGVVVSSTTHPDPTKWYNKSDVTLSWNRPDSAYGFSFELDQNPETTPDNTLDTTVTTTKTYEAVKDGIWYFHIKARPQASSAAFGVTTHFKIQIDTVAPKSFNLVSNNKSITFETTDELSGMDHYEVFIDDKSVDANAKSPFDVSTLTAGPHKIEVKAFDKATNNTKATAATVIAGETTPVIGVFQKTANVPVYLLILLCLLVFVLILINLWLLVAFKHNRRRSYGFGPVARLQTDIDEMLENLRHEIDHKLLGLTSKSNEELFAKHVKAAKAIESDIAKAKRKIDSKIEKSSGKE